MSIAASSNWMNNFIVGQVTPTMLQNIGFRTFIVFGVFSFAGALFIMFLTPETAGRTLEEMDEVFGDTQRTGAADAERLARIHKQLGMDNFEGKDVEVGSEKEGSSKHEHEF